MTPLLKLAVACVFPVLTVVAYRVGIVGGTDVVTGQPTPSRGAAFWALVIFGVLAEGVTIKLLWF